MGGGLTLKQATEANGFPNPPGSSGFTREVADSSSVTPKPSWPIHRVRAILSFLTLVATALFAFCGGMTVRQISFKVHSLAVFKSQNGEPCRDESVMRWRGTGFLADDKQDSTTRKISEASVEDLFEPPTKSGIPRPVNPFKASDAEILPPEIPDPGCRENSTIRTQIFGFPKPEKDNVIRLTTGVVHRLHIVSFNAFGQRRCGGGEYYETDLRSPMWKSRPPVRDLQNGTYQVVLHVHPRFAAKYIFNVTLLFSNFDGLKQLDDPALSDHEHKKLFHDKAMASLEIEFVLPRRSYQPQDPSLKAANVQELELPMDIDSNSATAAS